MSVKHLTIKDPTTWYQAGDRQIFLADVINASNSNTMSVGFARYNKGEFNEWIVTYNEALIVTKGVFTVRSTDSAATAKAGEVVFLTEGTKVTYQGEEDNTEVVYVSYPHWFDTQRHSEHADLLDTFTPSKIGSARSPINFNSLCRFCFEPSVCFVVPEKWFGLLTSPSYSCPIYKE